MEEAGDRGKKNLTFAQRLASPSKKVREKGLALLTKWLASRDEISEEELKKIWKGLFYCLWHSDKLPVQIELSNSLAQILHEIDTDASVQFFSTFLTTFRREWAGIDFHRLDKFYYCIRAFVASMLRLFAQYRWHSQLIQSYVAILDSKCLSIRDQFNALGISLHLADIYVEEILKCADLPAGIIHDLIQPFYGVLATAPEKSLLRRVREGVFLRLAEAVEHSKSQGSSETGVEGLASLDLTSIADRLFQTASLPEISQKNRSGLYEFYEEFNLLVKKLNGSSADDSGMDLDHQSHPTSTQGNGSIKESPLDARLIKASQGENPAVSGVGMEPEPSESPMIKKRKRNANTEEIRKAVMDKMKLKKKTDSNSSSSLNLDDSTPSELLRKEGPASNDSANENQHASIDSDSSPKPKSKKIKKNKEKLKEEPSPSLGNGSILESNDSESSPIGNCAEESPSTKQSKKKKKKNSKSITEATSPPDGDGNENGNEYGGNSISEPTTTPLSKNTDRRVHFSLESNLFFSKNGPVPPPCLRTPPSAAPRGSALKPGVKPGPINKKKLKLLLPSLTSKTSPSRMR